MIKDSDFKALIKVFRSAVKEIAEKETVFERRAVVNDWIELMGNVDRAMGGILFENNKEERLKMVAEFEERLKEFDYLEEA